MRQIHFNNAGDSPSPPEVTTTIIEHIQLESKVGGYRAAELQSDKIDKVYESVAHLICAGCSNNTDNNDGKDNNNTSSLSKNNVMYNPKDEIALVESATVGWTRLFYSALETKERELILLLDNDNTIATETKKKEHHEMIILVSEAEYAANLVAAVKFARDHNRMYNSRFRWRVVSIPSTTECGEGNNDDDNTYTTSSGVVDLDIFQSILNGSYAIEDPSSDERRYINPTSIAMVCITHIPTNCGIINPVDKIGSMINEYNTRHDGSTRQLPQILYLVDACQSVGQIQVNVQDMQCHALTATGRKYLRGPRGTGFLYVQRHIANIVEPSHIDHSTAPVKRIPTSLSSSSGRKCGSYSLEEESEFGICYTFLPGARRFEFWESNIAALLGLGTAIDTALNIGMDTIEDKCELLGRKLRTQLRRIDGVHVYHDNSSDCCGIVTFSVDNIDATVLKEKMQSGMSFSNEESVCCFHLSVALATSTPLDSACTGLGNRMLLRASLSYFNTQDEIDVFCEALCNSIK